MSKNLLIIKSSPRKNGGSSLLAEQAALAARESGTTAEGINLHDLTIHACDACDGCIRTKRNCVIQDDMQELYPKFLSMDALLLASPIYWFTYNAQLKLLIDRLYGLWNNHPDFLKGKPVGIILTYGDVDPYASGAVNAIHSFESMFRYLEAPIAGIVYGTAGSAGDIEKQPDLIQAARELGRKLSIGQLYKGND